METPLKLEVSEVQLDPGTQSRLSLEQWWVDELAAVLQDSKNAELEPVKVVRLSKVCGDWDAGAYILAGGHHRLAAYQQAGRDFIPAMVSEGVIEDAVSIAILDNSDNQSMPLKASEKGKAIEMLLALGGKWASMSESEIAAIVGCDRSYVGRVKRKMKREAEEGDDEDGKTKGKPSTRYPSHPQKVNDPEKKVFSKQMNAMWKPWREIVLDLGRVADRIEIYSPRESAVYLNMERVRSDMRNLLAAITAAEPYAKCPYCGGDKCKACKQSGWMPKLVYDRAAKELKQ